MNVHLAYVLSSLSIRTVDLLCSHVVLSTVCTCLTANIAQQSSHSLTPYVKLIVLIR